MAILEQILKKFIWEEVIGQVEEATKKPKRENS